MERKLIYISAVCGLLILALGVTAIAQQEVGTEKITGKVTQVLPPVVKVEADGKTYVVHAGPVRGWRSQNFQLKPGDRIEVEGVRMDEVDGVIHLRAQRLVSGERTLVLVGEIRGPAQGAAGCCRGDGCRHQRYRRGHSRCCNR